MRPVIPGVGRVVRDEPFALGEWLIPPGHEINPSIRIMHSRPDLYPEPERFRPERFLERTYSPFEFLPFGGGHRRCMGAALSDYEMRIVLATIVSHWDLAPTRDDWDVRHNIGMGPKHGVPMRVGQRRLAVTSGEAHHGDERVQGASGRQPVHDGTP